MSELFKPGVQETNQSQGFFGIKEASQDRSSLNVSNVTSTQTRSKRINNNFCFKDSALLDQAETDSQEQQNRENCSSKTKIRLSAPKQLRLNAGLLIPNGEVKSVHKDGEQTIPKEENNILKEEKTENQIVKPALRKSLPLVEKMKMVQERLANEPSMDQVDKEFKEFPEEYYKYYLDCYYDWIEQQLSPFDMKNLLDWSVVVTYSYYHSSSSCNKKHTLNELLDWSFALAYSQYPY